MILGIKSQGNIMEIMFKVLDTLAIYERNLSVILGILEQWFENILKVITNVSVIYVLQSWYHGCM